MITQNSKLRQPHPSFLDRDKQPRVLNAHRPAPIEHLPPPSSISITDMIQSKLGQTGNTNSTDFFTANESNRSRVPESEQSPSGVYIHQEDEEQTQDRRTHPRRPIIIERPQFRVKPDESETSRVTQEEDEEQTIRDALLTVHMEPDSSFLNPPKQSLVATTEQSESEDGGTFPFRNKGGLLSSIERQPLLQNQGEEDEDEDDEDEDEDEDENEETYQIYSPNFQQDFAEQESEGDCTISPIVSDLILPQQQQHEHMGEQIGISKQTLHDLYQLAAQVDSLVYKTVLDQDVFFQEAHNLKNNLLSPAQKQNPINFLMTIEEQSGEEELRDDTVSPTYQEACNLPIAYFLPASLGNMQQDLVTMLHRSKGRLDKFSVAQKSIVDYYKEIVKGLRAELRIFAQSLQRLEIEEAQRQIGGGGSVATSADSARSELEEMLNEVTVERDLLQHQLQEQKAMEERLKKHYFEKLTDLEIESNTMRCKYQSQVASLTAQVEKMSLDVSKVKGEANGEPQLDTSYPGIEVETLKEKLKEYTQSYSKLKHKHQEMKEKYQDQEEQIDKVDDESRRLKRENKGLRSEIEGIRSEMKRAGGNLHLSEGMGSGTVILPHSQLLDEIKRKLEKTQEELDSVETEKETIRTTLQNKLQKKECELQELTNELKTKFGVLESGIAQAWAEKERAERECTFYEQSKQKLEVEQEKLRNAMNQLVSETSGARKELMQREFDMKDKEIEIQALERQLEKLRETGEKKDEVIKAIEADLSEIKDCYQIVLNERDLAIEKLQANEEGHQNVLHTLQSELKERDNLIEMSNEQLVKKQELEQLIIKASKDLKSKEQELCSFRKQTVEIGMAVKELEMLHASYNTLEGKHSALNERFKALEKLRFDESQESKKLFEEHKAMTVKNAQLTKKLEEVCVHGQALKTKYIELQHNYKELQNELARVNAEVVGGLSKDIEIKEQALDKAQKVICKLNEESQKVTDELGVQEQRINKLKAENKELVQTNSQLAQRASAGEQLKNVSEQVVAENAKLKKLLIENEEQLKIAEEAWEQEKQNVLEEMGKMEDSVKEIENVNRALQGEISEQKDRIKEKEQEINERDELIQKKEIAILEVEKEKEKVGEEWKQKLAEGDRTRQFLVQKLEVLQKHAAKAFYHLVSKFPRQQQDKFIRSNMSLAKMLQSIQENEGIVTDQFELKDFLHAQKMHDELEKTEGPKMRKYAKILTTTKSNKHSTDTGSERTAQFEVASRADLKFAVESQDTFGQIESINFHLPIPSSLDAGEYSLGVDEAGHSQEEQKVLLQSANLMNTQLRSEYDKLAMDYDAMKSDLRKVLEAEVENVQKRLDKSEKMELDEKYLEEVRRYPPSEVRRSPESISRHSPDVRRSPGDLRRSPAELRRSPVELNCSFEKRDDMVLISHSAYRDLFAESRAQLKNEAGLIYDLKRQNALQQKVITEFIYFLQDPEIENESLNSMLAELLPEIESVRKEKYELIKNNESMLEQLYHLQKQLQNRNAELKQCETIGEQNHNLKNALTMGSKEIEKLIDRTKKRTDIVEQCLAIIYNLNAEMRSEVEKKQVPPLNLPIRKADETELFAQIKELAKLVEAFLGEYAAVKQMSEENAMKKKSTYEAALKQLETEIILEKKKLNEVNQKYQRDLIEQEQQWQKERAGLLEQIRLGLGSEKLDGENIEELTSKIDHFNALLSEKNKQLQCLEKQNTLLFKKWQDRAPGQQEEGAGSQHEEEMMQMIKSYTVLENEHKQLQQKYAKLRGSKKASGLFAVSYQPPESGQSMLPVKENSTNMTGSFDITKVQRLQQEYKNLKVKKENDKRRYKRRAKEFESVLRLLEIKMAHLTASKREMQEYRGYDVNELHEIKKEMAAKNPNLAQWLFMMESYMSRAQNCVKMLRSAFHWIHGKQKMSQEPLHLFVCELGTNYKLQEEFDQELLEKCEKFERIKETINMKLSSRFDFGLQEMPRVYKKSEECSQAPVYKSAEQFLMEIKGSLDFDGKNLRDYLHSTKNYSTEREGEARMEVSSPQLFISGQGETLKPNTPQPVLTTPSIIMIQGHDELTKLGDTLPSQTTGEDVSQRFYEPENINPLKREPFSEVQNKF